MFVKITLDYMTMNNYLPLIIAHRGFSQKAPENTASAYELAVQNGADGLECDIQITNDEQIVLFHDTFLTEKTGQHKRIYDFSLNELKKMDFGKWFDKKFANEKILTLKDFLLYVDKTHLFIEIKSGKYEHEKNLSTLLTKKAIALILQNVPNSFLNNVFILSFDEQVISLAYKLAPQINLIQLCPENKKAYFANQNLNLYGYGLEVYQIDQTVRNFLNKRKQKLYSYTCDDEKATKHLVKYQTDFIATNKVQYLQQILPKK